MSDTSPAPKQESTLKSVAAVEKGIFVVAALIAALVGAENAAIANVFAQAYPGLKAGTTAGAVGGAFVVTFTVTFIVAAFILNIAALMAILLAGFFGSKLAASSGEDDADTKKGKAAIVKLEKFMLIVSAVLAGIVALYSAASGSIAAGLFGQTGSAVTVAVVLIAIVTFLQWTVVTFFILNVAAIIGFVIYMLFTSMKSEPNPHPAPNPTTGPDLR